MKLFDLITLIVCFAALIAYINAKYLRLQQTIGIMLLSLLLSMGLLVTRFFFPGATSGLIGAISSINFHDLLMDSLLCFLLFAGAIHIDAVSLKKERLPIIVFSTIGVVISTLIIGSLVYMLLCSFNLGIGFIYCLLFAALISPTDPIAVIAILKKAGMPKSLETKIAGESLFNDGVAVVLFITILEVATIGIGTLSFADVSFLFLREAGGGLLFGLLLGYIGFYLLRSIDKYEVEVMITVAIVMGGYLLASKVHVSGPLAMVVAGILIGNKAKTGAVSDKTREYLEKFWELIDEILNAVLFMLVGFEMLVINTDWHIIVVGIISIGITLLARWVSLSLSFLLLRRRVNFSKGTIAILTWGGLRGGLSIALALSLPEEMHREKFLAITYVIVVFSILVQGLTIARVYNKIGSK